MDSIYIPLVRSPKRFTSHYYPDRPLILAILWAKHRTRTHCWYLRHQTTTTLARRPIQLFEATSQMSIARSVWYKYLQRRPRHTLNWPYRSTLYSLVPMTDIRLCDRQPTSDHSQTRDSNPGPAGSQSGVLTTTPHRQYIHNLVLYKTAYVVCCVLFVLVIL